MALGYIVFLFSNQNEALARGPFQAFESLLVILLFVLEVEKMLLLLQ